MKNVNDYWRDYKEWRRGILMFTLLELLIVIAIIIVLIATIAPRIKKGKCSAALTGLKEYATKLQGRLAVGASNIDVKKEKEAFDAKVKAIEDDCGKPLEEDGNKEALDNLKTAIDNLFRELKLKSQEHSKYKPFEESVAEFLESFFT